MKNSNNSHKRKLILAHEFQLTSEHMEHPSGKSLTVPDDSYSIKELLEKYTRGVDLSLVREGSFNLDDGTEDYDHPDLEKVGQYDMFEREMMLDEQKEIVRRNTDDLKRFKARKAKSQDDNSDDLSNGNQEQVRTDAKAKSVSKASKKAPKEPENE